MTATEDADELAAAATDAEADALVGLVSQRLTADAERAGPATHASRARSRRSR